ncbi:MAG: OmpP1/FadL family transporter [Synergistaceae bacterium]|nr:OmpP1/FadL family transporter [Synergistaceae bacterium]
MNKLRGLFCLLLFALILVPNAAFADGFAIYEWSAGGVAMGEAYMFAEDDPSLLAYNPAGITRLKGSWVGGGLSYINPRGRVDFHGAMAGGETWSNTEAPGYVPNLYYVNQQNDRLWWGIGVFSRFGNSTEYAPTWPGRYNSYLAKITGLTVQPTVAYKITDKLSVAAGVDINYIKLDLKKKIAYSKLFGVSGPDVDFELTGDNIALGWLLGFNYDINDSTSFAAVYRSKITQNMDADANLSLSFLNTGAHGTVTLPDSITLGLGHKLDDKTRIELGAVYTKWSTYDKLEITFDKNLPTSTDVKNWKDVWRYHIGVEHKLNDTWSIMGGYAYDNSPMPDETMDFQVPTGDRQTISIGLKKRSGNSELAFAWGYMWIKDRVVPGAKYSPLPTDYADVRDNTAHILSLSYTVFLK